MNSELFYEKNFKLKLAVTVTTVTLLAAAGIFLTIVYNNPPVLIVTEQTFLNLYGEDRIKRENLFSAIALFRTVKTVSVANDAGDDIVSLAVSEISAQPYCVIFPLRFAMAAKIYREENPDIPIVILEGRYPVNAKPSSFAIGGNDSDYFIYKTDIYTDFYKAGIAAAAITAQPDTEQALPSGESQDGEPQTGEGSGPPKNQPRKRIFIFWESSIRGIAAIFKQAVGDFILERTPEFGGQAAISSEQETESREPETESEEQAEEIEEQTAESGEEGAGSSEEGETAGESEIDAGEGELLAESEEYMEEEEEEAPAEEISEDDSNPLLPEIVVFSSFSDFKDASGLACVVMVDSGTDFFDRKLSIPVFAFSWLNPVLIPDEVALIIDDSPWVQVVSIVKMVKNKVQNGLVASKFHFLNKNVFSKEIIRKIKKSWKNAKIEF